MPWAGILLAFKCFGTVPPRGTFATGKGNVRRVFLACVLHALGWNPAGVQVFRNCASKGHLPMVLLAGEASHGR